MAKLNQNNKLTTVNPKLVEDWDYERNYPLRPKDVSFSSTKEVWWKCKKCGHKWKTQVRHRNSGYYKCFRCNSLAYVYPKIAAEWHPAKNGKLTPYDFKVSSTKEIWWKCSNCGNIFKKSIVRRLRVRNNLRCGKCPNVLKRSKSLAIKKPWVLKKWNYTKNKGISPYDYSAWSSREVWWKCKECGHEWKQPIVTMKPNSCFKCRSLLLRYPALAKEFHPTKNGKLKVHQLSYRSGKKIMWKCPRCKNEWPASVYNRSIGGVCPKCCWDIKGKSKIKESLLLTHPNICKDWDYNKNGLLKPSEVSKDFSRDIYWECHKCGWEWKAKIRSVAQNKSKCRRCNSLGSLNKILSKEWHPAKNGKTTPYDVTCFSPIKAWWKCPRCKNEWPATVGSRADGSGCPCCKKVILKDGTICDSLLDAYFYLLFKKNKVSFKYNEKYNENFGNYRYDFYLPKTNTYIEATSFSKNVYYIDWNKYLKTIAKKKEYVENILEANFKFVQTTLTKIERKYVRDNTKTF